MVPVMEALSSTGADAATAPAPIDRRNRHTAPVQRIICHSSSERWTSEPEGVPSVVAESRPLEHLGRSPGSEVQSVLCGRFTFPGTFFNGPSGYSKRRPHSQWRDRAGFAPDFPVMPPAGTQTRLALYHDVIETDKSTAVHLTSNSR